MTTIRMIGLQQDNDTGSQHTTVGHFGFGESSRVAHNTTGSSSEASGIVCKVGFLIRRDCIGHRYKENKARCAEMGSNRHVTDHGKVSL